MALDPVTTILEIGSKVFDRLFPDPTQKAQAQLELFKLQQSGELAQLTADTQLALQQGNINVEEAKNASIFVAGWRPFIGWVCGAGFAVQFVVGPFAEWASSLAGHPVAFPPLDLSTMLPLLGGMLGLGGFRTVEKVKGVA
jgi:hypothetical protein